MSKESVLAGLSAQIGQETHVSDWLTITQEMINQFAGATRDQQWIHVDAQRAQAESPFKTTVAHGFFTLSLIPYLTGSIDPTIERYPGKKLAVNYGLNRVRFPNPVAVNARLRSHSVVMSVEEVTGGLQIINQVTIEIEGQAKPACVAETISRIYF